MIKSHVLVNKRDLHSLNLMVYNDKLIINILVSLIDFINKTLGNELWVILLEKAWAKIYGSYDNIEGGLTRECLHDLTGAPTKTLWCSDQGEEVW